MLRPYYVDPDVELYHGDCREILPQLELRDDVVTITDPPYGDTSLEWDRWQGDWAPLLPGRQVWVFGSMRMWLAHGSAELAAGGFKLAQDVVWEKQNGTSFLADRFRRVHEHVLHFYRGAWEDLEQQVPVTHDGRRRTVRKKQRPAHMGAIVPSTYRSVDGGPRLQRSVLRVRNEHGRAVHPTQKPIGILTPLLECSTQPVGLVLDPFCGSGSTLVAARLMGRRAIGIEAREEYLEKAAARLAQRSLFAVA